MSTHPTFDPTHECDRCRCCPHDLAHLPSDEGIFLVRWTDPAIPSKPYYYLCNECMKHYIYTIEIIDGPDATDDEESVESEEESEDESEQ